MSLNLTLGRRHAKHRGKSGLELKRDLAAAERQIVALTAGIDQISAERNGLAGQLDAAQVDLAEAHRNLRIAGQEQARLQDALRAWEAKWANSHPVTVPAPRDLRTDDERPTVPTDVATIRAIYPVVPIADRPAASGADDPIKCPAPPEAATPAHVPAWAVAGEAGPAA